MITVACGAPGCEKFYIVLWQRLVIVSSETRGIPGGTGMSLDISGLFWDIPVRCRLPSRYNVCTMPCVFLEAVPVNGSGPVSRASPAAAPPPV